MASPLPSKFGTVSVTEVIRPSDASNVAKLTRTLDLALRHVRHALRQVRKSETLRLIKRIQTARIQKEKQREADVLTAELQLTKHAPVDLLSVRIFASKMARIKLIPKAKVLASVVPSSDASSQAWPMELVRAYPLLQTPQLAQMGDIARAHMALPHDATYNPHVLGGSVQQRVHARISTAKNVAEVAAMGVTKLLSIMDGDAEKKPVSFVDQSDGALDDEDKAHMDIGKPRTNLEGPQNDEASLNPHAWNGNAHDGATDDLKNPGESDGPNDDVDKVADDRDINADATIVSAFGTEWDAFVGSASDDDVNSIDGPSDESAEKGYGAQGTSLSSDDESTSDNDAQGLPSLVSGYVGRPVRLGGSDRSYESEYSDPEADVIADMPKKKNRPGQRARQA